LGIIYMQAPTNSFWNSVSIFKLDLLKYEVHDVMLSTFLVFTYLKLLSFFGSAYYLAKCLDFSL